MLGATMPKAAVNEDGEAGAAEDEIGVARDWLMTAPAGYPGGAKDGGQL